jgi:hypothetical protein
LCIKSNASPLAVEGAGVLCLWIFSMAEDDQDIARAFDSVRESYYRARRVTVSQAVARTELAKWLVQLSREGVRDEHTLTKAGLSHLRQLLRRSSTQEGPQRSFGILQALYDGQKAADPGRSGGARSRSGRLHGPINSRVQMPDNQLRRRAA